MRCLIPALLFALPVNADTRPLELVRAMTDGPLKTRLMECADDPVKRTDFSISHRGAPLRLPEHSAEGYRAAAAQGAGIIECDVTFTADYVLVCRHAQDDLAETTDILLTPLADKCAQPFLPGQGADCRASDVTLAEFRTLSARMDGADKAARTVAGYMDAVPPWRDTLSDRGRLLTHAESIALFRDLGVKFIPELKAPVVSMPHDGWTQQDYAQALVDEYKTAGIPPENVWLQSFSLDDLRYWIAAEPEFGAQAVYLDGRYRDGIDPMRPDTFRPSMTDLKAMGVNYIAPPIWMLLTMKDGRMVPSPYATEARAAELNIITWTLERSGPIARGGGWYFQSVVDAMASEGAVYDVLDVLAQDVGVVGVFSDWPATVSYYANCMGLE